MNINIELVKIKRTCDNSHKHCYEIVHQLALTTNANLITQEYFNEFLGILRQSHYNYCLSIHNNSKAIDIKKFIIAHSQRLKINYWDNIISYLTDDEILILIQNQMKLNENFIDNIIDLDISNNAYSWVNFINFLISINGQTKVKSYDYVIMNMNLGQFSRFLNKMSKNYTLGVDNVIVKFINLNKEPLKLNSNKEIGIKIINNFISRPSIIKNTYLIVSNLLGLEQKKEIFNKSISLYDKDIILIMLENKDICPDIGTIIKLTEKSYVRPEGSTNCKQIAEIIDLLCEYGLVITKEIILKLLDHGCYVNNLEKHDITVNGEILAKCASHSYYPYKFDIKPETDILVRECSKYDNLNTIKKLKEFGGIYTRECLEETCKISKNGRVIKYLVNECSVNVSEKCLENFQEAYKIEALDIIMKKYKLHNPDKNNDTVVGKRTIQLDKDSTMTVTPIDININHQDNSIEYEVKNKIRKFFDYKKKMINYIELYELLLKYLISNKLVIGNYFIINEKLSNLLKINHCTIMNIDQIHNILTYFVTIPENIPNTIFNILT